MKGIEDELLKNEYNPPDKCDQCGGPLKYQGVGEYKCENCGHLMYDDYGIVRNYLEANPGATAGIVSMATGVSEREIKHMLRQQKLEIRADSRTFLQCEACGKPITAGVYCEACGKLASAAYRMKKEKEHYEARKNEVHGVLADYTFGDDGRKRFKKNEDD